jgi:hypothetical protein
MFEFLAHELASLRRWGLAFTFGPARALDGFPFRH